MAKEKLKRKTKKTSSFAKLTIGEEKTYFIENLDMLLSTGMTILSALEAIKKDSRSKTMKNLINVMEDDIDNGSTIANALEKTNLLPSHILSLIKIGEDTGRLPENLKVIVKQMRKERIFRSKVRSAMMYPIFVFFITIVIGTGITWFILPRLSSVFAQMRIELPTITKIVIAIGEFLSKNGAVAVPGFLLSLGSLIYIVFFFKPLRFIGQAMLLKTPGIKKLVQEIELASFGYSLGNMLSAGLTIDYSLDSLKETTTVASYKKMYAHLAENVLDGNSFQKSLSQYPKSYKNIPAPIQQMLGAAEQSGHLPEILMRIGEIYEERLELTTKNLAVVMEPLMLVVVWICVVIIAVAVISPIYSLIGNINKKTENKSNSINNQIPAKPIKTTETKKDIKAFGKVKILKTKEKLNIYPDPSNKEKPIKTAAGEEVYEFTSTKDNWHELILAKNKTGWIESKYVKELVRL